MATLMGAWPFVIRFSNLNEKYGVPFVQNPHIWHTVYILLLRQLKSEFHILSQFAKVYFLRYVNTMKELQQMMEKGSLVEMT